MERKYRVLRPFEFSGSVWGDWGYEIDGVKSKNGYVSRIGARNAMRRALYKLWEKDLINNAKKS